MAGSRDDFSDPPVSGRTGSERQAKAAEQSAREEFEAYNSAVGNPDAANEGANADAAKADAANADAANADAATSEVVNAEPADRNVLSVGSEYRPKGRSDPKTISKFDEELDRSRKAKLWQRSNWTGSVIIVFILGLAYLNICADVRGEYGGSGGTGTFGGMIICSVTHSDGIVTLSLLMPNKPLMICELPDTKIGQDINLVLKPRYQRFDSSVVSFKGKIDSNEINGLIQDGLRLYPITLQKDPLASIIQQLRALIPSSNKQIDLNSTTNSNAR